MSRLSKAIDLVKAKKYYETGVHKPLSAPARGASLRGKMARRSTLGSRMGSKHGGYRARAREESVERLKEQKKIKPNLPKACKMSKAEILDDLDSWLKKCQSK